jgi:hypothetical protein
VRWPQTVKYTYTVVVMTWISFLLLLQKQQKQTPWSESASELHRTSDRHLSAKWYMWKKSIRKHVKHDIYWAIFLFGKSSDFIPVYQSLSVQLTEAKGDNR